MLIDINDLTDLTRIRVDGDVLRIGAMVRHADLLASAVVGEHYRILHDAERVIADPVVRNRGTVGGSLCQADPAEDLSAALARPSGRVRHAAAPAASGWCRARARTPVRTRPSVGPAEMLTEIRVPIRPGAGSAYEKVERRAGDWAVAAAGAVVMARRRRRSPTSASASPRSVRRTPLPPRPRTPSGARRADDETLDLAARDAGGGVQPDCRPARSRPTTSARSPANSPGGRCVPRSPAAAERRR